MYEKEATLLVKALEQRVRGRASAAKGPGPAATVKYLVEGTTIELRITFAAGKIAVQGLAEPDGAVLWGVREHPVSAAGMAQAVSEMTEWLRQRGEGSGQSGGDPAPEASEG
jgi:hypothetical protein